MDLGHNIGVISDATIRCIFAIPFPSQEDRLDCYDVKYWVRTASLSMEQRFARPVRRYLEERGILLGQILKPFSIAWAREEVCCFVSIMLFTRELWRSCKFHNNDFEYLVRIPFDSHSLALAF